MFGDPLSRDAKLREGVYRIVIAAPAYESEVRYLQLTSQGMIEIESAESPGKPVPIPTEWKISLRHLVHPHVKLAVRPIKTEETKDYEREINDVAKLLPELVVYHLKEVEDLTAFVTAKQLIGYDAGRDKGMRAMFAEAQIADFEVNIHVIGDPGSRSLSIR